MPLTKEQALKYVSAHEEFRAKNDIAGLLNSYSDDVMILSPHAPPAKGKEAMKQQAEEWKNCKMGNYKLEFDVTDVVESEKLAAVVGTWKYVIEGEAKDVGNYMTTLKYEHGDWKVSWTIWNSTSSPEAFIEQLQKVQQ